MRSEAELEGVTLLGNNKTQYKTTYSPEVLGFRVSQQGYAFEFSF